MYCINDLLYEFFHLFPIFMYIFVWFLAISSDIYSVPYLCDAMDIQLYMDCKIILTTYSLRHLFPVQSIH